MDDQMCPRCRCTKYLNPSMKMMVNDCGHPLCEACVSSFFLRGSGACPECQVPLKRSNFRVQFFEDPMVEKEVNIRRRVLRDYNKKEEDFQTEAEYNDYLEEIETIVYNLTNNIDIVNTNKRIEAYKRENRDIIQRNKNRIGREESELIKIIELEKAQKEARRLQIEEYELEQKKLKKRKKEELIDNMMKSETDAKQLVSEFSKKMEDIRENERKVPPIKPATHFSTGIKIGGDDDSIIRSVPTVDDGPLYVYERPIIETDGPPAPSAKDIVRKGYIAHARPETLQERAGGYTAVLSCQRALQEAMQGLF